MPLEELADNVGVVVAAYLAAFLPWTALSSLDYISPVYKTVRDIRRDGIYQLLVIFVPSMYVIFYIYIQAAAADYKEMAAALVALAFSALHLARTAWGLWQTIMFRRFAATAIAALRVHAIHYSLLETKDDTDAWVLADRLLINDQVLDNQIFHGEARCFLQYDGVDLRTSESMRDNPVVRLLQLFVSRMKVAAFVCTIPFRMIFHRVVRLFNHREPPSLRQVPYEPVELWLRWAVVFSAQGLRKWIDEFKVAKDPDVHGCNTMTAARLFQMRQAYFAGETLASAASHISVEGVYDSPNFLLWEHWPLRSNVADGRATKKELLEEAKRNGSCLPFEARHVHSKESSHLSDIEKPIDYGPYSVKLQRIVEEMPTLFGTEIAKFDVEMLEWLTILIYIGKLSASRQSRKEDSTMAMTRRLSPSCPEKSTFLDTEGVVVLREKDNELNLDDQAIQNLLAQLGLPRYALSSIEFFAGSLRELSSFPLPLECFTAVSSVNRLVLKIGEIIDFWLALLAGDHIAFLFDLNDLWPRLLRQYREEEALCGRWQVSLDVARELSHDLMDPEAVESSAKEDGTIFRTNQRLRTLQRKLEIERLRYQFAAAGQRYWHLEQTLVFMGYGMEAVRSELASRVKRGKGTQILDWEPKFQFCIDGMRAETSQVEVGRLSKELSKAIVSATLPSYLQRRAVQVRLLWEAQCLLQQKMRSGSYGPSSLLTVLSAIMAFPALSIDISREVSTDTVHIEGDNAGACKVSFFESPDEGKRNGRRSAQLQSHAVRVRAQGSPQNISVVLRFGIPQSTDGEQYLPVLAAICDDDAETGSEECIFIWELWRDTFQSRLEGLSDWQRSHELSTVDVHGTDSKITSGMRSVGTAFMGTGDTMAVWSGWDPFRFTFCRHELETPGFILQPDGERNTVVSLFDSVTQMSIGRTMPTEKRDVAVSYSESKREYLNHACLVVQEAFCGFPVEFRTVGKQISPGKRAELTFKYAMRLLKESSGHVKRVLFLLETAAVELCSIEALSKYIELLTDNSYIPQDIDRVVRLLKRCIYEVIRTHDGALLSALGRQERMRLLRPMFESLLGCNGFSPQVAIPYVTFLSLAPDRVDTDVHRGVTVLQQAFLHSRDFEAISALGREEKVVNGSWQFDDFRSLAERRRFPRISSDLDDRLDPVGNEEVNQILCRNYLERAVSDGKNPHAMNNLGLLLENGRKGVKRDRERAVALYEAAIANGAESQAMNNLANIILRSGDGAVADFPKAWELYVSAAEKCDNSIAAVNVAMVYINGSYGVPVDVMRGLEGLEKVIRTTADPSAMYNLATLHTGERNDIPKNLKKAIELYERSAGQGHVDAMYNLACLLTSGQDGITRNVAKAKELYKLAILKTGHVDAMTNLGVLLRQEGTEENQDIARELYECAMREGSITAMVNLANMLSQGKGCTQDLPRAVELYERALESEPATGAMVNLASILQKGAGNVQKDVKRAISLNEQAIELGREPNAMDNLANWLLSEGSCSKNDAKRAVELYHLAVSEGRHTNAMFNLGVIYAEGKHGVERDAVCAKSLYEMAIEEGQCADSMYNLSNLLLFGAPGITVDVDRAIILKERAIENGDVRALVSLALHYLLGKNGVERRPQKAVSLLERAIREGETTFLNPQTPLPEERQDVEAMFFLGLRLIGGSDGVQKDAKRAMLLFEEAVTNGSHSGAMCTLAHHLRFGAEGIERDSERAIAFYERAIKEKNSVAAMVDYASWLLSGDNSIQRNADKAINLFERAIEKGSYMAMCKLANAHHEGVEGVPRNPRRAVELYERAIATDAKAPAKPILARIYYMGDDGVEKDRRRALELYEQIVAEDGGEDPGKIAVLSGLVTVGAEGIGPDPCRGLELRKKAANMGELGSCYVLGFMYEDGYPPAKLQKDISEAKKWYRKVAASENPDQKKALECLSRLTAGDGAGSSDDPEPKKKSSSVSKG